MSSCRSSPPIRSFHKDLKVNNTDLWRGFKKASEKTNELFFFSCGRSYVCNMTVTNPVFDRAPQKSCKVSFPKNYNFEGLEVMDDNNFILSYFGTFPTLNDLIIQVVRMSDCNVVELSLPNVEIMPKIYPKAKSFDLIYSISTNENKKTLNPDCQNNVCRVTYDTLGKVINGPRVLMQKPNLGKKVSRYEWFPVFLGDSFSSISLVAFKLHYNNGKESTFDRGFYRIQNETSQDFPSKGIIFEKLSTHNSKFSFCIRDIYDADKADCRQYDSNAKLLFKFNLTINDFVDVPDETFVTTYNLRDGGMILLLTEYNPKNQGIVEEKLRILHVREDGQYTLPPVNLDLMYKYVDGISHYFFEDDKEFCLKTLRGHSPYLRLKFNEVINSTVKFRIDCITKNYFSPNQTSGNVKH